MTPKHLRMWIEIDTRALRANTKTFRRLIGKRRVLMAVVKSNAYGHGLVGITRELLKTDPEIWFGVDSIVEGLRLREEGIQAPILVLGATLPARFQEAARENIIVTISNFEALGALSREKAKPAMHIKIDTGMSRQGFLPADTEKLIRLLKQKHIAPAGMYTHFAAAKDRAYPSITLQQFSQFEKTSKKIHRAGFRNVVRHAAASAGAILFPETHSDMVRIGMALWGHWPSEEARLNVVSGAFRLPHLSLFPVLTWKTRVSEVKTVPAGSFVGYDATERVTRHTRLAVLPIGYWHGYDRGLSSIGEVLVRGKRARVLGRVSMDMVVVDVTGISGVTIGDSVVLIGKQGKQEITAEEVARKIGTSPYEVLTRINPLIERIYK